MGSLPAATGTVVVLERVDGMWPGVTARVVGQHDGHTMVDLGVGIAHGIDADLDVVVSAVGADHLWRQRARAHRTGELIELVPDGEIDRIQRRLRPRRRISLPVSLVDFDHGATPTTVHGQTVDLGPGGARVWVPEALPSDCDPTLILRLPDGGRLVVETTVVERILADVGFEYRLVFRGLDPDSESSLEHLARAA